MATDFLLDYAGFFIPTVLEIIFIIFVTTSLLICSYLVLLIHFAENTMYMIISLFFLTIILGKALLLLCNLDFFSILYVMIYLGAIVVLFLFVLMTANLRKEDSTVEKKWSSILLFTFIFFLFFAYFTFPLLVSAISTPYNALHLLDYIIPTGNWQSGTGFATWVLGLVTGYIGTSDSLVFSYAIPLELFVEGFGTGFEVYLNDIYLYSTLLYGFFSDYTVSMSILLFFTLVVSVGLCLQVENDEVHVFIVEYYTFSDLNLFTTYFFRYLSLPTGGISLYINRDAMQAAVLDQILVLDEQLPPADSLDFTSVIPLTAKPFVMNVDA